MPGHRTRRSSCWRPPSLPRSTSSQRARLERLRAEIVFARTRGSDAPALLLDAARRLEPLDAAMARETHLEAMAAAMYAGRLGDKPGVRETAEAAQAAPAAPQPPRAIDLLLDGLATRFTEGYSAGVPPLRRALDAFRRVEGLTARDVRWLWLACRAGAGSLGRRALVRACDARAARRARGGRAPRAPDRGHAIARASTFMRERSAAASSLIEEADAIVEATGLAPLKFASLMLAAWRGNEAEALGLIEAGMPEATARGEGMALGVADWATALLYNGLGRYAEALAAAQRACEYDDVGLFAWALVELIEAGVRSGATDAASAALDRLSERTQASGTDWALGIEARLTRAAERRTGRGAALPRGDRAARAQPWRGPPRPRPAPVRRMAASREPARRRARAASSRLRPLQPRSAPRRSPSAPAASCWPPARPRRRRTVETRDVLTPQEAQIARMASDRQTNPEIGAKLFISPRTVEYHLRKVFTKLDISSRKELRGALAGRPDAAVGAPR